MPTKIEYLDATWNPLAMRCTKVSPACDHCWHLAMAKRLACNFAIPEVERKAYASGPPVMTHRLEDPLHWKKPRRIGVQFMGDLFHKSVPFTFLDQIWETMGHCRQHTFLVLTKRPDRMSGFLASEPRYRKITSRMPLPNVWLGVTAEDQARADERIPILLQIPAAKRFVSYEPALGPLYLDYFQKGVCTQCGGSGETAGHYLADDGMDTCQNCGGKGLDMDNPGLDWIIAGGESGPGARPSHPDWFRSVRDQCKAAGVPFFFKQWGEWAPIGPNKSAKTRICRCGIAEPTEYTPETFPKRMFHLFGTESVVGKLGKKRAGRLLDGRAHEELPNG